MDDKTTVTDSNVSDDRERAFIDKWDNAGDEKERRELALNYYRDARGLHKKVGDLGNEVERLSSENADLKTKSETTVEGLSELLGRTKSEKERLDRTLDMLEHAHEKGLKDVSMVVELGRLQSGSSVLDSIIEEVQAKVGETETAVKEEFKQRFARDPERSNIDPEYQGIDWSKVPATMSANDVHKAIEEYGRSAFNKALGGRGV